MMHDEWRDLLFLVIAIFAIAIALTIYLGLTMKPDKYKVNTLVSRDIFGY